MSAAQQMMIALAAAAGGTTDPYFSSVVALLHCDGVMDSTTFTDQKGKIWTPSGTAKISTAQSLYGGASGIFNGSDAFITTPQSADFDFGTGDFTVELAVRFVALPSSGAMTIVGNYTDSSSGYALQFRNDGPGARLNFGWGDSISVSAAWSPVINQWYQVTIARASGVARFFVDGVQVGADVSFTTSLSGATNPLRIGSLLYSGSGIQWFNGYVDEVRVTKGIARYTSNFTPPSTAFPNS